MDEAKWIKIDTGILYDDKINFILSNPNGDAIAFIWIQILCLAGIKNNGGVFSIGKMNYTAETFAASLHRNIDLMKQALDMFVNLNMLEVSKSGAYSISHWGDHQSLNAAENKKDYDRKYHADKRAKEKENQSKSNDVVFESYDSRTTVVNSSYDVVKQNKNKNQTIELDSNLNNIDLSNNIAYTSADEAPPLVSAPKEEHVNYQSIVNRFNEICKSLPKVKEITEPRKKALKRMQQDGINFDEYFQKIQDSDFLCQRSGGSWQANFDWIIQPRNIVKIQEGNYDNKDKPSQPIQSNPKPANQPQKKPVCGYGDMHSFDSEDIEDTIIAQYKNRGISLTRDDVNF